MMRATDFSTNEGDDGTGDWPSHRNKVVGEVSDSEFSSSDDKGEVQEYMYVNDVGRMSTVIGGRINGVGRGPAALAPNLLMAHSVHACSSRRHRE
jgi:hypothetical protein